MNGSQSICQDTSASMSATTRDLLSWLRSLALNPNGSETWTELDHKVFNQTIHARKCLVLDNIKHRPRKRQRNQSQDIGEDSTVSDKSGDSERIKAGSNPSSCLLWCEKEGVKRPVIPVGRSFQTEIPVWIAPTKMGKFYGSPADSKTLKWLGNDVWPTYSLKKKLVDREVGKGRSDECCSCSSPRSSLCINRHIKEAREILREDLGDVFKKWGFDQMGEEAVLKSWTGREEERFEALVKRNPLKERAGQEANFWKLARKAFSYKKSKGALVRYYRNVFLIRRMRSLTRSSSDCVDSDDDHNDAFSAG